MRSLLLIVSGVSAIRFNKLFRNKSLKKSWKPNINKEKNEGDFKYEKKDGECRCPEGEFFNEFSGVDGKGACLEKYDLADECGFYPSDVRPRVCKAGLTCKHTHKVMEKEDVKDDYEQFNYGKPAKCMPCTEEDGEDCGDHKKTCAKTVAVSGKMCYKLKVDKVNCGEGSAHSASADASAEAEASATATATATAKVPGATVVVKAEDNGNVAKVEVPIPDKEVTVEKEVTTTATASASADATTSGDDVAHVNGKAEVEECVEVEEVMEHMGYEHPLSVGQGEKFKKEIDQMAYEKAVDHAIDAASEDACIQAKEIAQEKAKAKAEHAAQQEAESAAEEAAEKAAAAAAEGEAKDAAADVAATNAAAQQQLTPEQYAEAQEKAEHLAEQATAGATDLAGAQGTNTATNVGQAQSTPTAPAVEESAEPGVKQNAEDVANTQP